MEKYIVFVNPFANKGRGPENARKIEKIIPQGTDISYVDITKIDDVEGYIKTIPEDAKLVLTGGDGTLNRTVNALYDLDFRRELLFFPAGSGNDFIRDLQKKPDCEPFPLNGYMKDLPVVKVNGITCRFLNGIGFGLDGYCCEESDRLKALGKDKSYKMIAFEGLMGKFKPVNASVTVDGVTKTYDKVWMAPTMFGSFFGGGVNIAPKQKRDNPAKEVTSVLVHGVGKLMAALLFLTVTAGNGDKYPQYITYRTGHHVRVEFDRPVALQIDGETVLNVTEYEVDSTL